jgi:hypothetical protein
MSDIIQPTNTKMAGGDSSSLAPASASCCERRELTPSLFGETTSTIRSQSKKGSNAPCSETKDRSSRQSLSDRLTPSLITSGLVKGITPKSIRKNSNAFILDGKAEPGHVSSKPGGAEAT